MNRRFFMSALAAAPLIANGRMALAQNAVVDAVNVYLTGLTTMISPFTQESSDGSVATGLFYLDKPGKMRFEYDPPSPALIIADGEVLAIYDKKSTRGPQVYPQSSTPLSLLTRNDIDVTQSKFVRLIETRNGKIQVVLFDPEHTDRGSMRLIFDQNPMELSQWVITEGNGLESVVRLGRLTKNISIDPFLFSIVRHNQLLRDGQL